MGRLKLQSNETGAGDITLKPQSTGSNHTLTLPAETGTLVTTSGGYVLPAGAVSAFAMTSVPSGWLECNGGAISREAYADLFNAIGTTWGFGDGVLTFNLPDLRGEFIRGFDNGRAVDSGRSFASSQAYAVENHQHAVPSNRFWVTGAIGSDGAVDASHIVSTLDRTVANEDVQPYGGTETRPRNIAMMYCIKY